MIFSCPTQSFLNAIETVSKKEKNNKFGGSYFRLDGSSLEIQAANSTMTVSTKISDVETDEPGEMFIPPNGLCDIVKKLPDDKITVSYTNDMARFTSGQSNFCLKTMDIRNFMAVKLKESCYRFTALGKDFLNMIRKTVFSCAKDEGGPIFTGCLLTVEDGKATMAATNTHRLSVKSCAVNPETEDIPAVIIPAPTLHEVLRIMGEDEEIAVDTDGVKIKISSPKASVTSVLIDGNYPDYRRVIPKESTATVKINTVDFRKSLERISVIAKESKDHVMRMEFAEGNIHIISENTDIGTVEDNLTPVYQTGEFLTIGFNILYFIDMAKAIDGDVFTMEMTKSLAPCKITTDGEDDYFCIVSPVRLKDNANG